MGITKFSGLIVCLLGVLASSVTRVEAQEKYVADRIVGIVGSSMVLYSDVVTTMDKLHKQQLEEGYTPRQDLKSNAFEMLLLQKLLSNQARLDSLELNPDRIASEVEKSLDALVVSAGSIPKLEAARNKAIYQIREDLRQEFEEMYCAQLMQDEVQRDITVTPSEVERYYNRLSKDSLPIVPEQYVYAQIVKYPASTATAKLRTRESMLELRERIIKGESFGILARLYSADPGSAAKGGEMDYTPVDGFVKAFGDALKSLKPGQISEVIETEFGFHILELMDKKGDLYKSRHILMRPTFTSEEMKVSATELDSARTLILNDSLTFAQAAMQFSDDKFSKMNGGVVSNHELLELYNNGTAKNTTSKFMKENLEGDYAVLSTLKVDEVSKPYQSQDLRGNVLTKIISLKEIIPAHEANLKEDYAQIESIALADKKERIFKAWVVDKISGMYVKIDPEFQKCEFSYPGWIKK